MQNILWTHRWFRCLMFNMDITNLLRQLQDDDMIDQLTANANRQQAEDTQEVKRSLPLRRVDEHASEFERSRQASKTWSMGQD